MTAFDFNGEESGRFTRFAKACISCGLEPNVFVIGREPLTSRPVSISGLLKGAVLDGYIRYIEITETQSGLEYWVGGSNSTRSINTRNLTFEVKPDEVKKLEEYGLKNALHVPRIRRNRDQEDDILWTIETSVLKKDQSALQLLVHALSHADSRVQLEAGLTLRAFASFIVENGRRQLKTEAAVLDALKNVANHHTRSALVEDLGYFGSDACLDTLAALLRDPTEEHHVRWAAAIALGRLPGVDLVSQLLPGLDSTYEWTKAATLLSIARQTTKDQRQALEPVLREYLSARHTKLMNRYACLGLSRLEEHDVETSVALAAILGDDELPISIRGYAALAISSAIAQGDGSYLESVTRTLGRFTRHDAIDMAEPEAIWGVEFLAELASILEQNEVSSVLHGLLADHFDDWRSGYYTCMKFYEQAESSVRRNLGDESIIAYQRALRALRGPGVKASLATLPPEATATIQFRDDIVSARLMLQSLLGSWLTAVNQNDLASLSIAVEPIRQTYRRYVTAGANIGPDRQLVAREVAYIRNTADLVAIIQMLIEFDELVRTSTVQDKLASDLQQRLHLAIEQISKLRNQFDGGFAKSLRSLIERLLDDLTGIATALKATNLQIEDKMRIARSAMTQIRSAFWAASWPMPGRACPVYGLGRASFIVRKDGLSGVGTEEDPLVFPAKAATVLLVSIRIFEMAPGGATTLQLHHSIGNAPNVTNIPIVEDQHTCSIHIREPLPTFSPVRMDISLIFNARDCTQRAETQALYLIASREN